MKNWLTKDLLFEVKQIFQPHYERELSDDDLIDIAANLVDFTETYLKFQWKKRNAKTIYEPKNY